MANCRYEDSCDQRSSLRRDVDEQGLSFVDDYCNHFGLTLETEPSPDEAIMLSLCPYYALFEADSRRREALDQEVDSPEAGKSSWTKLIGYISRAFNK
jgi:hypothetical protein